jgi:hypothetical protein|tara:strand:- start:3503 stop:3754 length:252 start_codon:yes stop_codon:yes gene_type:complete
MTEINSIQAYHHRLDMNQYYVNKQKIVDYHNKLRQISKDALDNYNERVDRAKEAQLQIYNRQGKFVNQISQIPSGKSIDILIK